MPLKLLHHATYITLNTNHVHLMHLGQMVKSKAWTVHYKNIFGKPLTEKTHDILNGQ